MYHYGFESGPGIIETIRDYIKRRKQKRIFKKAEKKKKEITIGEFEYFDRTISLLESIVSQEEVAIIFDYEKSKDYVLLNREGVKLLRYTYSIESDEMKKCILGRGKTLSDCVFSSMFQIYYHFLSDISNRQEIQNDQTNEFNKLKKFLFVNFSCENITKKGFKF